jgi:hypothetical protein
MCAHDEAQAEQLGKSVDAEQQDEQYSHWRHEPEPSASYHQSD